MSQAASQPRLCPHCANTIASNAVKCPYCKAEISAPPQWPGREDAPATPVVAAVAVEKRGVSATLIALVLLLLGGFGLTGYYLIDRQRTDAQLQAMLDVKQKELQERDAKIDNLEKQLAKMRQQSQGAVNDLKKAQAGSEENRKKLADAKREIERLSSARAVPASRATKRGAEPPLAPATTERRAERTGTYETVRPTMVFEGPATTAQILSRIAAGTEVTVVRTIGTWFEIRSKHGNPPGFVRADDVKVVRAN